MQCVLDRVERDWGLQGGLTHWPKNDLKRVQILGNPKKTLHHSFSWGRLGGLLTQFLTSLYPG